MIVRTVDQWWQMYELYRKHKKTARWFLYRDGRWWRVTSNLSTRPADYEELLEMRRLMLGDEIRYNEGTDEYVLFIQRETWI